MDEYMYIQLNGLMNAYELWRFEWMVGWNIEWMNSYYVDQFLDGWFPEWEESKVQTVNKSAFFKIPSKDIVYNIMFIVINVYIKFICL